MIEWNESQNVDMDHTNDEEKKTFYPNACDICRIVFQDIVFISCHYIKTVAIKMKGPCILRFSSL